MYNRNLVFAAACLGMLLFGIVFLSLGSVNNMLAERFHLDDNGIGTLTALLPFGILAGSLIFGPDCGPVRLQMDADRLRAAGPCGVGGHGLCGAARA